MSTSDRDPQAPIVAAYSPSSSGREPVEFGIAASRVTGAPLTVLTIRHGGPLVNALAGSIDEDDDARAVKHLRTDLQQRHIEAEVVVRDARTAGAGVIDAMEELSPQMVVLAVTKRRGVGSALLGTTIERVLHAATCPVAVVPRGYQRPEQGVQLIGVAYTPTSEGIEALRAGAMLARNASVRLRAIMVLDPKHAEDQASGIMAEQHRDDAPEMNEEARERMDAQSGLRDALAQYAGDLDGEMDVLYNDPADGLVAASRHVDLLVMGSRGRGPRRATVLGSVSRKVAEECACPVVILPRGAEDSTSELISRIGTADS